MAQKPGYPSPVPPKVAASPLHTLHLWHRIRDTQPSSLAASTVLQHDSTLRSILSTFISLQPLVALEVSRFAADPLLLLHLRNSRHQLTPSMGLWLLLSISLRRDFYAEQLTFQWSTKSLLQAGQLSTTNFSDDVLGVRAIPSLLTRAVHVTHDAPHLTHH